MEIRLLDLISELGELSKEKLKQSAYGKDTKTNEYGPQWSEELGDVFFSLVCVANSTGVDLDKALIGCLDKYKKRIEKSDDPSSAR